VLAVSTLALLAALLAGCGSSSSSSSSSSAASTTSPPATTASTTASAPASGGTSASSKVSLEANPEGKLEYNTKSLSAKAGAVTIDFTNMAALMHNVTVESSSGTKVGGTPTFSGGSKSVTLNLKPGTYKFFCSVPGHRQAGMEGTLTVN
jgi:plastocyanin